MLIIMPFSSMSLKYLLRSNNLQRNCRLCRLHQARLVVLNYKSLDNTASNMKKFGEPYSSASDSRGIFSVRHCNVHRNGAYTTWRQPRLRFLSDRSNSYYVKDFSSVMAFPVNLHNTENFRLRYFHSPRNSTSNLRQYSTKAADQFTMKNEIYRAYLDSLGAECQELGEAQMLGQKLDGDQGRRLVVLRRVTALYEELKKKCSELDELIAIQDDAEMKDIVEEEKTSCLKEIDDLEKSLVSMICPVERVDDCDIILEVECGAGGQEAMLFSQEVFDMYQNYAVHRGWQFVPTLIDKSTSEGGYRKASATISGQGVFGEMKYEGGVHRVQRIPKTESKGRIHTSTIAVAILPQPSEIDVELNPKDLHIDTFRASGAGGQHVNTTESAVRIKHLPTGIVAECQISRSQINNKATALVVLRTRIYEKQLKEQMSKTTNQRKLQVGQKERSEKIRTYNFPQDRITDHRLGQNFYNITSFLSGGTSLQTMIHQLQEAANLENLQALLEVFEKTHFQNRNKKSV